MPLDGPFGARFGRTGYRTAGADRRREQQGHLPGLALVPSGDQAFRVGEHLSVGRAPSGGLSVGLGLPLSFHFSAVEAHAGIVAETECKSMRLAPAGNETRGSTGGTQAENRGAPRVDARLICAATANARKRSDDRAQCPPT